MSNVFSYTIFAIHGKVVYKYICDQKKTIMFSSDFVNMLCKFKIKLTCNN